MRQHPFKGSELRGENNKYWSMFLKGLLISSVLRPTNVKIVALNEPWVVSHFSPMMSDTWLMKINEYRRVFGLWRLIVDWICPIFRLYVSKQKKNVWMKPGDTSIFVSRALYTSVCSVMMNACTCRLSCWASCIYSTSVVLVSLSLPAGGDKDLTLLCILYVVQVLSTCCHYVVYLLY